MMSLAEQRAARVLAIAEGDVVVQHHIRLRLAVSEYLSRHAQARHVSVGRIIRDILQLWVVGATDPRDPRFNENFVGVKKPGLPIGSPDYLESLGLVGPESPPC